jgi:hypothetical protein
MHVPPFSGDPRLCRPWLQNLEAVFASHHVTQDDLRIQLAGSYLRDAATQWHFRATGDAAASTWSDYRKKLLDRFLPPNVVAKARKQLKRIKQGNRSLDEYLEAFEELAVQVDGLSEQDRIEQFLDGLHADLARFLYPLPTTFADMLNHLAAISSHQQQTTPPSSNHHVRPRPATVAAITAAVNPALAGVGPDGKILRLTDAQRDFCRANGICFKCREQGHVRANCPNAGGQ